MVTVEMHSRDLLPTFHATDALLELVEARNVFLTIPSNLACGLARNGTAVSLIHDGTCFAFLGAAYVRLIFLVPYIEQGHESRRPYSDNFPSLVMVNRHHVIGCV